MKDHMAIVKNICIVPGIYCGREVPISFPQAEKGALGYFSNMLEYLEI